MNLTKSWSFRFGRPEMGGLRTRLRRWRSVKDLVGGIEA